MGEVVAGSSSQLGNPEVLNRQKVALICSVKCPGSVILRTYDLMRDLRSEDITVVSGFHSPMEKECLNLLLRGTCGVAVCYARKLPNMVPSAWRGPVDQGRLLLISAVEDGQDRATRATSAARNRLVVDLADILFVPYASAGGMTEAICKEAIASGKPVYTFEGEYGANLTAIGARTVSLSGVAVLLHHTPRDLSLPARLTRCDTDKLSYCVADIRRDYPRAYMKWTQDEEVLLQKLRSEGRSRREIAQALQRQPGAISSRLRKIERRTAE